MTYGWILVLLTMGHGVTTTAIPMESYDACEAAGKRARKELSQGLDPTVTFVCIDQRAKRPERGP